jgi:hypothetical protein
MSKSLRSILILPVLILLVGTACNLSSGPTPPRPVPTIPPQKQPINQQVQTLQPDPNSGKVTITITEAQITTFIIENLKKDYESILNDPVVIFQPNQVELYATVKGDAFSANGKVVMSVTIDPNGKPVVEILEANFGPFPIPSSLLDNLSTAVDNAIADSMKDYQSEYRLESITFATGVATIVLIKK